MTRQIAVLVNPAAGRGRAARLAGPVHDRLTESGATVRLTAGRDADEARDLARALVADGPHQADALVVVGGDGIVSLALDAVAGGDVPLGVVPAGTGNDLVRELGIPQRDPLAAVDVVVAGYTRSLDLGQVGDRWFSTILCSGFDSRVAERVSRMSWPRGRLRYDLAIVAELGVFRPVTFSLELDGVPWHTDAMVVAVGNTASYGGGLRICEGADASDGLLDVTVIAPLTRRQLAMLFPKLSKGTHVTHPAVQTRRAREVSVAAPAITAYADGERVGALPLTVRTVPGALRVFSPPPR